MYFKQTEEENQSFLFDWDLLIDAKFTVSSGEYGCLFSRVYLEDYALVNKGSDETNSLTEQMKNVLLHKNENKNARKCSNFLKKIGKLGYIHAFDISTSDLTTDLTIAEGKKNETTMSSNGRSLKSYEDMELFDVNYQPYNPSFNPKHIDYAIQATTSSVEEEDDEEEDSKELCDSQNPANYDKMNFDFSFQLDRDKKLVASDAKIYFKKDKEIMKYWFQRYRLFSKFDKGILMDREGWFSVTPERIAEHIADRMVRAPDMVIVDAFTGMGGNAIQFALQGAIVYAVDIDPIKLRCAANNARIYGVEDRIIFICADFFHVVKSFCGSRTMVSGECSTNAFGIDAVFLSPPWGGPAYLKNRIFDINSNVTPNGVEIYKEARKLSPNICYFLPKNTDVKQLIQLAGPGGRVEIEQSVLNTKVKTICAYYGKLVSSTEDMPTTNKNATNKTPEYNEWKNQLGENKERSTAKGNLHQI